MPRPRYGVGFPGSAASAFLKVASASRYCPALTSAMARSRSSFPEGLSGLVTGFVIGLVTGGLVTGGLGSSTTAVLALPVAGGGSVAALPAVAMLAEPAALPSAGALLPGAGAFALSGVALPAGGSTAATCLSSV